MPEPTSPESTPEPQPEQFLDRVDKNNTRRNQHRVQFGTLANDTSLSPEEREKNANLHDTAERGAMQIDTLNHDTLIDHAVHYIGPENTSFGQSRSGAADSNPNSQSDQSEADSDSGQQAA